MEIRIPDLGDFDEVEVIEVLVKPGDTVSVDDPLITLETEKAAMDVPATASGRVTEVKTQVGDRVSEGQIIAVLESADGEAAQSAEEPDAEAQQSQQQTDGGEAQQAPASANGDGAAAEGATRRQPVTVPDLGDFDEVDVIDVLVSEGDEVDAEQGLITLETEKAAMDVPAPAAGRVTALKVKAGDKVRAGDEIAELETAGSGGEQPARAEPQQAAQPQERESTQQQPQREAPAKPRETASGAAPAKVDEKGFAQAHASPSVRKLARELGVDLGRVRGSGAKGRVTGDDVKQWVKDLIAKGPASGGAGLPEVPRVDFSKFGEVEREPLSRIQKIAGPRLHASWVNLPHVTQHDHADITQLEDTRKGLKGRAEERGIRLTPLAFILRACVLTLREFPRFNASLDPDGEHLVVKKYMHLGFAVDTPGGLVVPVIRDADRMDVFELAAALADLSVKARDGKLKGADMQGGCFTVSSLGGIGGTAFTPIINAPEVAILGVSRSRMEPVWNASEVRFDPRLMLPVSLSYDHRVIDGADGARFTRRLCEYLGQVELLLRAEP